MRYNPTIDMPRNAEELKICVDHYFNQGVTDYNAEVVRAAALAEATYPALPESEDKPTLGAFIEQHVSMVPPAKTREEWRHHFLAAGYGPQPEQEIWVEPHLTPEQIIAQKRTAIDAETSAAILAGFDYAVNGQSYHFNYDSFDQQNFADTANACLLQKSGAEGLPATVVWNGYLANGTLVLLSLDADAFLALYMAALAHKKACMDAGSQKKAALIAG